MGLLGVVKDIGGISAQAKTVASDPARIRDAIVGLATQKLSGTARDAVEIADILLRNRSANAGNDGFNQANPSGARDPLLAALSRPDALLTLNWYLDLPTIDGLTLGWERVEEATLPQLEYEQTSNFRAGKDYHYPTKLNISNMTLRMFEGVDGATTEYFYRWQSLIRNPVTGLIKAPSVFKKPIQVTVLDAANYTVMFLEYTGCWPVRIDTYNMQSSNAERVNPQVELAVDDLRIKFGKFESGQIPSVVDSIGQDFPQSISRLPSVFPQAFTELDLGSLPFSG